MVLSYYLWTIVWSFFPLIVEKKLYVIGNASRVNWAEIPVQEPERRAQAELMFAKLKKSYEVLSDPHRRAIYDCLGKAGLQVLLGTVSWDVQGVFLVNYSEY